MARVWAERGHSKARQMLGVGLGVLKRTLFSYLKLTRVVKARVKNQGWFEGQNDDSIKRTASELQRSDNYQEISLPRLQQRD